MEQNSPIARAWGREIRSRRKALGDITQAALARDLGVSQVTVSRWESGTTPPSLEMQAKLIERLGIDPWALHRLFSGTAA